MARFLPRNLRGAWGRLASGAGAENIKNLLALAGNRAGPDDSLILLLADHGGVTDSGEFKLGEWSGLVGQYTIPFILASEIRAMLDPLPFASRTLIVATCDAGNIAPAVLDGRTTLLTQTLPDEIGWNHLDQWHDGGYAPGWHEQRGNWIQQTADRLDWAKDADGDGRITWQEVHDYGVANDEFGPALGLGEYIEHPQYSGVGGFAAVLRTGDTDGNGSADFADYQRLEAHFGLPGRWVDGDFDRDGAVSFADYQALEGAFVPEPSGLMLLLVAGCRMVLVTHNRRKH